ncbi:hypothetical protein AMS68_008052 [Peltaster fructicola]|uniref:Chromo domain-containing protein n=1 Tax=Peltaster fructicola TaxID=286661 RepID=A0A6H0Y6L0_9PEZI|nr:hypothetical protein AMS68_008052 [Peltaster fructicola]
MASRVSKKKRKQSTTKPGVAEPQDEYDIKAIVAETDEQYEVEWENTWLPKDWVSESAIIHWKQQKAQSIVSEASSPLSPALDLVDDYFDPIASAPRTAGREIRESPPANAKLDDQPLNNEGDSQWQLLTLQDGSQIRVLRSSYVRIKPQAIFSANSQPGAHTVNGSHDAESSREVSDSKRTLFQARAQNRVVSSTTEESPSNLVQEAQLILSQTEASQSHNQHSSSKDSSGALSQSIRQLPDITPGLTQVLQPTGVQHDVPHELSQNFVQESSLPTPPPHTVDITTQDRLGTFPRSPLTPLDHSGTRFGVSDTMANRPTIDSALQPSSPSPLKEDSSSTTPGDMATSLQAVMHNAAQMGSILSNTMESAKNLTQLPSVNDGVHLLGLHMIPSQRDQYMAVPEPDSQHIANNIISISSQELDDDLVEEGEDLLRRLRSIVTHPDLDTPEAMTQYDVDDAQMADWDSRCSSKFRFLREMFQHAHGRGLHIVVAVDGGQEFRLLSRFLKGLEIPSASALPADDKTTTAATIMDEERLESSIAPADVVIGLNPSWNGDGPLVLGRNGTLAPCVQLVAPHTVEHVELSLPRGLSKQSRLKLMWNQVEQLKKQVQRSGHVHTTHELAQGLVSFLTDDVAGPWPLQELRKLRVQMDNSTVRWEHSQSRKRPLEDADDRQAAAKRQQLDGAATLTVQSTEGGFQAKLDEVEAQRNELEKELLYARTRLSELERTMEGLFDSAETSREELTELQRERNEALNTLARLKAKVEAKQNDATSLRQERVTLRDQLKQANNRLISHAIPERAELEKSRQAEEEARIEAAKAKARVQGMEKDLDYARSQYRSASDSAYSLSMENRTLAERLDVAEKAAALELAKARQISLDNLAGLALNENKKLKVVLANREAELRSREEELARLKDLSRGRMTTRGSSVPRSPRMGSPMKQMLSDGYASRHGSPAGGEFRERGRLHPLRNG